MEINTNQDEKGFIRSFIRVLLFRKDILPTTLLFMLVSLFFTAVKIQLEVEQFRTLVQNRKYILVILVTIMLYFTLALVFSLNEKLSILIFRKGKLFASLIQTIFWLGLIYFVVRNYPEIILKYFYYILLAGAVIWLSINALIINNSFMKNVGFEGKTQFSWVKLLLAIALFGASFYFSYWFWNKTMKIQRFNYWIIFSAIFGILLLIFPKYSLNTASYYIIVMLYFTIYLFEYFNTTSSGDLSETFQFVNKITINLIMLAINYFFLFATVGRMGKTVKVGEEGKDGTGRSIIFIFLITISYLTLEFIFPTVLPDISNPDLFLLLFRFFSIMGTSLFVYFYKMIKRTKKKSD